jgi:HEPN domain-containing protein
MKHVTLIELNANRMKNLKSLCVVGLFILVGCGKGGEHQHTNSAAAMDDSPNQALYDQVMDVHDEVMPKMDDIMKLKRELQDKIANSPDMVVERKEQLEQVIANLDSASNAMMSWMHEFNPLPDSVDQEKAREYLESEMEQIRKVKTLTLESIEKAKEEATKN